MNETQKVERFGVVGRDGYMTPYHSGDYVKFTDYESLRRQLAEAEEDRDSWRDQASERVKDWDAMRACAELAEAKLAGAEERARLLLDAKNYWAVRAKAAEYKLALAEQDARRYRDAIVEHNGNYGECDKKKCGYAPYKYRECPDCPAQHKVDLVTLDGAAAIAAGEGE